MPSAAGQQKAIVPYHSPGLIRLRLLGGGAARGCGAGTDAPPADDAVSPLLLRALPTMERAAEEGDERVCLNLAIAMRICKHYRPQWPAPLVLLYAFVLTPHDCTTRRSAGEGKGIGLTGMWARAPSTGTVVPSPSAC